MHLLLLFFFLISLNPVTAQLINNSPKAIDILVPAFTPEYIRGNKILTINVDVSIKQESSRIKDKGLDITYFFNTEGMIIKRMVVDRNFEGYSDTATTEFFYKGSHLSISRTLHNKEYTARYYDFDAEGRLTKEVHTKETNASDNPEVFKIGTQEIKFIETYIYTPLTKNQTQKKILNDQGKVYKESILHYYDNGLLKEENLKFTYTGIRINQSYIYNEQDYLRQKNYFSDASGDINEETNFMYEGPRLTLERLNRNGREISETFYFYNKENSLLEAQIIKNLKDQSMLLRNFKYVLYK